MHGRKLLMMLVMAGALGALSAAGAQTPPVAPDSARALAATPAGEKTPEQQKAELEAQVRADPSDGKAWNDLGVLYASEGDFAQARDCFISAVQTDPAAGDYHRNLGQAFSRLGMDDVAVREFQAYRRFDTLGGRDAWQLIGDAQLRAGKTAQADSTYREGIKTLGPDVSAALMRLVLSRLKLADDAKDEQTSRDLLGKYAPLARTWLQTHDSETEDGRLEAKNLVHLRVTMLVDDAQLMEQSGLADEATSMYREAYDLDPERLDLLPRLVDAYLSSGQDLEAKVAARLARDRHPDQPGTWIASGKVYEHTDRLEDAIKAYRKAYAMDSSLDDVRGAIGKLLMRLGRDSEAAEFLRPGVNGTDAKPEVVYNYALSLMREMKYHAAIASLKVVVQDKPEMVQAWMALAQCYQATEQQAEAASAYAGAFAQNPDPKLMVLSGTCALKAKLPDQAITAYQQALAADPTYAKARYNLSLAYMDAGRYTDAVASFDQLLAMEGPSYRAYFRQGLAYYYLKDYAKALESLEQGMELQETPDVLNAIGRVYAAKGDNKEAVSWYNQAKKLQKGS